MCGQRAVCSLVLPQGQIIILIKSFISSLHECRTRNISSLERQLSFQISDSCLGSKLDVRALKGQGHYVV
jgi:hypothetical protein